MDARRLSPFKRGDDLDDDEAGRAARRRSSSALGGAIDALRGGGRSSRSPTSCPLPLEVHRHQGEPCPRCGTTLEAVYYEDYVMSYCPQEQTGGKVLKDRRLSRLLK